MSDVVLFRKGVVAALVGHLSAAQVGSGRPVLGGPYPYVTTVWAISAAEALSGDAQTMWLRSQHQLSLWEKAESEDGSQAQGILDLLDGAKFGGIRLKFQSSIRTEDPDGYDLVHTAMTFSAVSPSHTSP